MSEQAAPAQGYIEPPTGWPRAATPAELRPHWAGEFKTFDDWVAFARPRLSGARDPMMGAEVQAICIDALGRRCTMGGHFMRARDDGAFPVRYFWDCRPPEPSVAAPAAPANDDGESLAARLFVEMHEAVKRAAPKDANGGVLIEADGLFEALATFTAELIAAHPGAARRQHMTVRFAREVVRRTEQRAGKPNVLVNEFIPFEEA